MSNRLCISCGLSLELVEQLGPKQAIDEFARPEISKMADRFEKKNKCRITPDTDILLDIRCDKDDKPIEWRAVRFYINLGS